MVRSRMVTSVAGNGARVTAGQWGPPDKARALERLAEARANLAGLERQAAPAIEPSIRAAVEQRQRQIDSLRQKLRTAKRGGGKRVRQQIEALEGTQRLVIECLGFRSFQEFYATVTRADATRVDRRILDAARQEVDLAERHFFDTAEMAIPVPPQAAAAPFSPPPRPPAAGRYRSPAPRWAAG
jgi:hypothetical protein